ncbi:MAG: DegT/DnrJ/EryC1/StrS family aminotransferase, partial [Balneolaceae bacterium]
MEFIDLNTQYRLYQKEIDARMRAVMDHGQYIMGPEVTELEGVLAEYVGVKHCITVANGTDSLEIALRALNIGPGDEVITVPFSWISTAEVIAAVGARPVFIDIEPDTFNMDVALLEAAITDNTKAIMPVGLFGQMPDLERINAIAEKHDFAVIEDAAQSFGATRNGKRSCGASLIGSTSFFPAKPLGCYGDGGALFTDDDTLAETMKAIRSHGGVKRHHHTHIGMNGRFDTLQAAVILGKWPHFEDEVKARREIGGRYSELLKDIATTPKVAEGNTHVYAQYTIRVDENKRDEVVEKLKEAGIPVGVYYPKCFHEQPVFEYLG